MSEMLQPGDVLDDSYEIVEFISKGGFGAVYRARQLSMDRDVALKLLIPGAQPDFEGLIKRFRNEVKAVRNLRHPNTVQIYDFHESKDGQLYFTMEYLDGRSLRDLLKDGEAISPKRTANILAQSLKSLAEAHSTGIIHRDIKPANIMLVDMYGEDDFVKVLDFGIAKAVEDGGNTGADEPLTRTGYLVGTVRYMAPERIAGDPAGSYSDIYSLGLVGASLLAGRPLLGNSSRLEAMQLQMSADPLPIPQQITATALGPIIRRSLQKNPKTRYQSAEEMLDDLLAVPDTQLGDSPLQVTGELPLDNGLGGVSSSGIEPTTVDSEIQSGPAPTSRPKPTAESSSPRQEAPTGWGQHEAVRSTEPGNHGSSTDGTPPPYNRTGETAEPDERTELFSADAPPKPDTSEVADQPQIQPPPRPQSAQRKPSETASKRIETSASEDESSRLPVIAGVAIVLIALGGGLTWFLLQGRSNSSTAPTPDPATTTASAEKTLVELRSDPTGATVKEDGERLGVTPLEVKPQDGRRLALELQGYETRKVELGPNVPPSYTLKLTPSGHGAGTNEEAPDADAGEGEPSSLTMGEENEKPATSESAESPPDRETGEPESEPVREKPRPRRRPKPKPAPEPEEKKEEEVIPVFGSDDDSSSEEKTEPEKPKEDIPVF